MYLRRTGILAVSIIIALSACQTGEQKEQKAETQVKDAEQNLKEVTKENEVNKMETATTEDWKKFKSETDSIILENEMKMKSLSDQLKLKGKKLDALFAREIDTLQMKNKMLKKKLDGYELTKSDWKKFQEELNQDMDELGKSLKDFTIKNKP